MRTVLTGLILLLAISISAQTITPLGWCSGRAYFKIEELPNGYQVQIRVAGSVVPFMDYITPSSGSTTITVDVPQATQSVTIQIQVRYRNTDDSSWPNSWVSSTSVTSSFPGCASLPIRVGPPSAKWVDERTIEVHLDIQNVDSDVTLSFELMRKGVNNAPLYTPVSIRIPVNTPSGKYTATLVYFEKKWTIRKFIQTY